MKKNLLALAALVAGLSASATPFDVSHSLKLNPNPNPDYTTIEVPAAIKPAAAPARAEGEATTTDEVYYTLAADPYTALAFNNQSPGMQVAMAFQIEPSFLSTLTDGQITGITYYTGAEGQTRTNKITKAYVFITNALDGTYLYTQEVQAPETAFTRVDVTLDQPFTIPAGKIFVGVYFSLNSVDNYSVVIDGQGHLNDKGGWIGVRSSSLSNWSWDNYADQVGFVTLGATIKSSTFPTNNVSVIEVGGQPAALVNEPFGFTFLLTNNGVDNVENITVEYGVEGEPTVSTTLNVEGTWGINQSLIASVEDFAVASPVKKAPLSMKVTEVNGAPNVAENPSGGYNVTIVPAETALPRNAVVEEFTSTSCVYCPVGYTTMEKIHEETDGTVIPVGVHINSPGSDPMTCTSYGSVANKFADGVPSSVVNRTWTQYPVYDDLIELVEQVKLLPGVAAVSADAVLDKDARTLTVTSRSSFAFDYTDGDANFILAYGVTENEVGPYTQKNGYSGSSSPVYGGWERQPTTVKLTYNDVARQLDKYSGITGSIPAVLTPGQVYEYTHEIKLVQAIKNLDNINVIVYLINRNDGSIENACMIKSGDIVGGIDDVVVDTEDTNAPVEYYNLQGIRVNEPSCGIFIRRQGSKTSKVCIK